MPDLDGVVILAVIFFAVAFAGVTAMSGLSDTTELGDSQTRTGDAVVLAGTEQYTEIDDELGRDETVYDSLGMAVELAGTNDSYVQSNSNIDFASDDTWTLSLWASLSPDASIQQRAVASLNGRVVVSHYPVQGNWSAWYYDDGSTDSYQVNVSTSGGAGTLQNVVVWSNGTHLAIYRNNTVGDMKNITGDNIADAPVSSSNWHGRLEELRTFDDALNNTQRQQLYDSPIDPLPSANRTSRVMFDQADKNSQLIFFTSASLTQSNVSFSDGHPGSTMDGQTTLNDITGATDYVWDENGPRIYVVEGGELDGAPVAYVDYTYFPFGGTQRTFADDWSRAVGLAPLAVSVLLLVTLLGYLMLLRGR